MRTPLFRIGGVVALAVFVAGSRAAAQDRRDGNWWLQQPRQDRLAYATGLIDGSHLLAPNFEVAAAQEPNAPIVGTDFWSQIGTGVRMTNASKYLQGVTNGQLVDGIDQFYADAANRLIHVSDAAWVVLNRIAGRQPAEIDALVQTLRRTARRTSP